MLLINSVSSSYCIVPTNIFLCFKDKKNNKLGIVLGILC